VQLEIPEYAQPAAVVEGSSVGGEQEQQQQPQRRLHLCFHGSSLSQRQKSLRTIEQSLRSKFGVHLVVPGRKQVGPLAVVGKSYKETLPAVDFLMRRLVLDRNINREDENNASSSSPLLCLNGSVTRNVKNPNETVFSGRFWQPPQHTSQSNGETGDDGTYLQPYWLFESDNWNVMACPLTMAPTTSPALETTKAPPVQQQQVQQQQTAVAEALQIGFDNLRFRLGNAALSELEVFLHPPPLSPSKALPKAFAIGDPTAAGIRALYEEISQTRVNLPTSEPS